MRIKGYGYISIAALLWGFIGPFSKLAFSEGVQPTEVAFWRAVLAWGFFFVHAAATRNFRINFRDLPMVALFAITGITLFYSTYQMAILSGGAALASVLLYTAPAWVTLMARFFYQEPLTRSKILALALTLIGVVCVSWGGGSTQITWSALLFGLAAGFCYSLYYIFGKHFSSRYTSATLFFYLLPIGAVTLLPWVEFSSKSPIAWSALFFIAALCTYGAYYCYYIGVKYLEASRAAIAATLEPVAAAMIAFIWWGETFGLIGYVGCALILGAVLMMVWDRDKP